MGNFTNFSNGVASFGHPLLPNGLFGKNSKAFFVNPADGSDGHDGRTPTKALATVTKALSLCTDKQGDVIYLLNDGNTSGTSRDTATIAWSLDNTHLIGVCAPSMISQRARISPPTSATAIVTPQLTVSGNGNYFANVSLFEGTSEDTVDSECVRVTGSRNVFKNVAMMNMGDVTNGHSGDQADSCHLKISGGEENLFQHCYIGLDTAVRSNTNANVELVSAAARNVFEDCMFPMFSDGASADPFFVKIDGSGDIDRFVWFKRCLFYNAINSAASAIAAAMTVHASCGGSVLLDYCTLMGVTNGEWAASTNANIHINMPVPDSAQPAGGAATTWST